MKDRTMKIDGSMKCLCVCALLLAGCDGENHISDTHTSTTPGSASAQPSNKPAAARAGMESLKPGEVCINGVVYYRGSASFGSSEFVTPKLVIDPAIRHAQNGYVSEGYVEICG